VHHSGQHKVSVVFSVGKTTCALPWIHFFQRATVPNQPIGAQAVYLCCSSFQREIKVKGMSGMVT
jgi:hypothetical protein